MHIIMKMMKCIMSKKELAKDIFLGKNGQKRLNGAQSIIEAFKDKLKESEYEDTLDLFKSYGSGRAPQGFCGAYYAVYYILQKIAADKNKDFDFYCDFQKYFIEQLDHLTCKDLKANKVSCIDCIEKSAHFLEKKI